jgi:hypothetical protein
MTRTTLGTPGLKPWMRYEYVRGAVALSAAALTTADPAESSNDASTSHCT